MNKQKPSSDRDELELLPRKQALARADALLRNMLNTPPDPHTPKAKPKKARKREK